MVFNNWVITAVVHGLIWSASWTITLYAVHHYYPQSFYRDYPAEIQKIAQMPVKGSEQGRRTLTIAVFSLLIGYYIFATVWIFHRQPAGLLTLAVFTFLLFMTWNLFDLLILDWLVVCTLQPRFLVLPGTEGHPVYRNYGHHLADFFKGTGISMICALVIGGAQSLAPRWFVW